MDLGNLVQQFTGGNMPANAPAELGQWLQNYQSGQHDQVPHQEVQQAYQQWAQNTNPQQVQQATQYGYQQVPQQNLPGIAGSLLNAFQQHGLNPQAAGVQTTNPQQMGPQDLAKLTQYAHEKQPDAIGQL